jgi:Fungal protein kinase
MELTVYIGVLNVEKESFMHDLESFFWTLFWICIEYVGPGKRSGIVVRFEKGADSKKWNNDKR